MIFGHGNYAVTATIGGNGSPLPVALTSTTAMFDGRTGSTTGVRWGGGAQTVGSNVAVFLTVASSYASPAIIGVVHVANVVGLPVNTLVEVSIGGTPYQTRLVAGRRGELNAVFYLPLNSATNTPVLRFYNDVNGAPTIPALTQFGIGEIFVGGVTVWPTLLDDEMAKESIVDPTQWQRSNGGQLWQFMRKPTSQLAVKIGRFAVINGMGGLASTVRSGLTTTGVIDARTLAYNLSTTPMCHVCAFPHKGFRARPNTKSSAGFYYDQNMASLNGLLGRPTALREISLDKLPYMGWGLDVMEGT